MARPPVSGTQSQAQPEPKTLSAAALKRVLKASKDPKASSMAAFRFSEASASKLEVLYGARTCRKKRKWL